MKIGAEDKTKLYVLAVLAPVAGYMVYSPAPTGSVPIAPAAAIRGAEVAPPAIERAIKVGARNGEFRPPLRPKSIDQAVIGPDVNPIIRFDVLATAMAVPAAGGERDLFQISRAPGGKLALQSDGSNIHPFLPQGPRAQVAPPTSVAATATAPEAFPYAFFGEITQRVDGKRTIYFRDGDDVLDAVEGITLKGRYVVVQIGLDRVLVEDKLQKRRQTVQIEPET